MEGEQGEKNGCSGQCLSKHRELWDGGDATFAHIKHGHMAVVMMMMITFKSGFFMCHFRQLSEEQYFSTLVTKGEVIAGGDATEPALLTIQ